METSISITITETRALTVDGRLVAGETAQVTIGGATPTALYLVAPDQTVVAACEAFTPSGQGSGGTGFLQLATEQVAALFAHTPAGRMVAVWALVNDANGVAGAGWIPVVSAPMPDELIDLDIDFYLRASQVGAGLAIVDGKLVCTVNPDTYLTKTEAAATYATQTALAGKYTKPATGIPATDLAAAVQTSLDKAGTSVQSVNGVTPTAGAISLTGDNIPVSEGSATTVSGVLTDYSSALANLSDALSDKADIADLRYALPSTYIDPDPVTGKFALNDRKANWIKPDGTSVTIVFPAPVPGRLRDFEVYIESQYSIGPGNMTLNCEGHDSSDVLILGNGGGAVPDIPLGDESVLYFSEFRVGYFILKGEKFVAITGGN
jgi:hypothetical protein